MTRRAAAALATAALLTSELALAAPAAIVPAEREATGPIEPMPAPEAPPTRIGATPEPEPPAPELPPEPAPEATPEGPEPPPTIDLPDPAVAARAQQLRRAGAITMASGGGVALAGLAMIFAFTVKGNRLERDQIAAEDAFQRADCNRDPSSTCTELGARAADIRAQIDGADTSATIAGALFTAGLATMAIGGIVYRRGHRKRQASAEEIASRLRLSPSLGGAVLMGRF